MTLTITNQTNGKLNQSACFHLESLPTELIALIISKLPSLSDIQSIGLTSRRFSAIANSDQIWKIFAEQTGLHCLKHYLSTNNNNEYNSQKPYEEIDFLTNILNESSSETSFKELVRLRYLAAAKLPCFIQLPEFFKTQGFFIALRLNERGEDIRLFPKWVRNNKRYALLAIENNPIAIHFLTQRLQRKPEIICAAADSQMRLDKKMGVLHRISKIVTAFQDKNSNACGLLVIALNLYYCFQFYRHLHEMIAL
jgi:hypothetical protein